MLPPQRPALPAGGTPADDSRCRTILHKEQLQIGEGVRSGISSYGHDDEATQRRLPHEVEEPARRIGGKTGMTEQEHCPVAVRQERHLDRRSTWRQLVLFVRGTVNGLPATR